MTPEVMMRYLETFHPATYAPESICRELFMGLLERDPKKRFNTDNLKIQAAFEFFGWNRLEEQSFPPPITPQLRNLEYVEKKFRMESVLFAGEPQPYVLNFDHELVHEVPTVVNIRSEYKFFYEFLMILMKIFLLSFQLRLQAMVNKNKKSWRKRSKSKQMKYIRRRSSLKLRNGGWKRPP